MNGSKGEKCGHGFCCANSLKPIYLGIILFITGIMLQNDLSAPQIIEVIGALMIIIGLFAIVFRKEK